MTGADIVAAIFFVEQRRGKIEEVDPIPLLHIFMNLSALHCFHWNRYRALHLRGKLSRTRVRGRIPRLCRGSMRCAWARRSDSSVALAEGEGESGPIYEDLVAVLFFA